jgi:hypothetical protein
MRIKPMPIPTTASGTADEVTVDTFTLHGCRCDEPVLDRLIEAVRNGITPPYVTLEATRERTRFRRSDLAAVRTAIGRSLSPGDRRSLDRLSVEALSRSRTVVVALEAAATVTVESIDAAWALGKAEQIRRILQDAGGRPRRRQWKPWRWAVTGALVATAAVLSVLRPSSLIATAGLGIALVGGAAAGFLIARLMVYRSRPIIWIDGALPRHGWRQWSVGDRIAFVALVVAALAFVVPLLAR